MLPAYLLHNLPHIFTPHDAIATKAGAPVDFQSGLLPGGGPSYMSPGRAEGFAGRGSYMSPGSVRPPCRMRGSSSRGTGISALSSAGGLSDDCCPRIVAVREALPVAAGAGFFVEVADRSARAGSVVRWARTTPGAAMARAERPKTTSFRLVMQWSPKIRLLTDIYPDSDTSHSPDAPRSFEGDGRFSAFVMRTALKWQPSRADRESRGAASRMAIHMGLSCRDQEWKPERGKYLNEGGSVDKYLYLAP